MTACNSPSDELAEVGQPDASCGSTPSCRGEKDLCASGYAIVRRTPPPNDDEVFFGRKRVQTKMQRTQRHFWHRRALVGTPGTGYLI